MSFDAGAFRLRVENTLVTLRKVLHQQQHPTFAESSRPHRYEDKFGLAEAATNLCLAVWLQAMTSFGLDEAALV